MDLTLEQATDVIRNEDNPSHSDYYKNNPETVASVETAFSRAYPGETDLSGVGPVVESQMAAALADVKAPQAQDQDHNVDIPPEVAQAEALANNELRAKWGSDYDQNLTIVR